MSKFYYLLSILTITQVLISCDPTERINEKSIREYERLGGFSKVVKTDSAEINLRIVPGSGDTIVFLHGFGPLPNYQWQKIVEDIYPNHTMVVPDQVFFGESTSNYENYSPAFQASQIQKALYKSGIKSYFITGLSFGGLIASMIAHENPDQVKGLILLDALSQFISSEYSDSLAIANGFKSRKALLLPQNGKEMKKMLNITYYDPPSYPSFMLDKPAKSLFSRNAYQKERMLDYLINHENEIRTGNYNYDGPVCIIWGKEDILIPVSIAYKIQSYYKYAEEPIILEKTGHAAQMESPEEISNAILKFIENKTGPEN